MRFNNQQVKLPKASRHVRDLSCCTITSMPFYQNSPVYIQEVVPGDKVSLSVENFCRLNTMRSPTFGRVTIRNRVFFVPLRTVWNRFDEFISQQEKRSSTSALSNAPYMLESNLLHLFNNTNYGYTSTGSSSSYDVTIVDTNGTSYLNFTRKGRYLYRILVNLGYNINFGTRASSGTTTFSNSRQFSALPLMAFYRIWCDFFQYKMSTSYKEFDDNLLNSTGQILNMSNLYPICDTLCTLGSLYDDDYFTLAGDSTNIPIYSNVSAGNYTQNNMLVNMESIDGNSQSDVAGVNVTGSSNQTKEPALRADAQTMETTGIGASAINFLQRAADYFQRKFRGGSTVVQQYFNEYGVKLSAEEITHSKHLGSFETPVSIMDVTGTAADNFGAQTSLGRGAGTNGFSWSADEFGYIIVTAVVVAHGQYNHGTPRLATRLKPLEFYHPDFDGLGMQAIRQDEICSGSVSAPSSTYDPDGVFGMIPTYADYKVGHDTLSGDFIIRSSREAYKGYYLSRQYRPEDYGQNPPVAGETFRNPNAMQNGWTPVQYDNIFLTPDLDNFLLFYNFNVKVTNAVRPLLDNYDWYSDGETLNMQGGGNNFGDN